MICPAPPWPMNSRRVSIRRDRWLIDVEPNELIMNLIFYVKAVGGNRSVTRRPEPEPAHDRTTNPAREILKSLQSPHDCAFFIKNNSQSRKQSAMICGTWCSSHFSNTRKTAWLCNLVKMSRNNYHYQTLPQYPSIGAVVGNIRCHKVAIYTYLPQAQSISFDLQSCLVLFLPPLNG